MELLQVQKLMFKLIEMKQIQHLMHILKINHLFLKVLQQALQLQQLVLQL